MTDYLLIAIAVLLTLNLAVNVSTWSRGSGAYNHLAWWVRDTRQHVKRRVARYRRGRNGRKRL